MLRAFWVVRIVAKNLLCRLHLAGLVNLVEFCDTCGIRQPLVWYAADAVWLRVTGDPGGVLCPRCFAEKAVRAGLFIRWVPQIDSERDARGVWRPCSQQETTHA